MHEEEIPRFNESPERCSANGEFLERFYALFLASSCEVSAKFAHTGFRRQTRMSRTSPSITLLSSEDEPGTPLERLP